MRVIYIVAALLTIALPAVADDPGLKYAIVEISDDVAQRCAKEWPDDFTMEAYCRRRQIEAFTEYRRNMLEAKDNQILKRAMTTCTREWGSGGIKTDWTMVSYCYKRQKEAAESMGKF